MQSFFVSNAHAGFAGSGRFARIARVASRLVFAGIAAGATACTPTVTRYYTLSAVDAPAVQRDASAAAALIAVGPVSLPDYIDRPQIVVRTSANTVEQATFDQWGGSLDDMIPRLLVGDLASRLPGDHFVSFPQAGDLPFDYRVAINISQFDVSSAGEAVLVAHWQVRGKPGAGALIVRETVARVKAEGASYPQRVAALSGAIGELTNQIAATLAALPRDKPAARKGGEPAARRKTR